VYGLYASPADFRALVTGALLTGARHGELASMIADDFNADSGTVRVRISKGGKPRHILLTQEGREFFAGSRRAAGQMVGHGVNPSIATRGIIRRKLIYIIIKYSSEPIALS
jgi:integrase